MDEMFVVEEERSGTVEARFETAGKQGWKEGQEYVVDNVIGRIQVLLEVRGVGYCCTLHAR